jgi:hypothetical protein
LFIFRVITEREYCILGPATRAIAKEECIIFKQIKLERMKKNINSGIRVLNAVPLTTVELESIEGGGCLGISFACGLGLAASTLTGGIGAIIFGPATGGLCYAAYKCQ